MGIPKFFRYISERYPLLSELVKENQIPEFDNLYLDMNGIIHNCSHPDDNNVHFRITEEQIFLDIFHYIDTVFRMIQPKKLFFMAVDGVAPRAKMNQQRGRRFRSAKDAELLIEKAKRSGEQLPDTDRFDSNCITPGTAFMVRLQDALKHFIQVKISTNSMWQKCKVILSGHETPGEGEHKIMEYIRYMKSQPGFNPNTRHCLYGLDADLVMLGLCTHELHFSLLREEVKFGSKAKKNTSVDTTRFFLLHLGLFREYIELEFSKIKTKIPFNFDIEKILDDWILMCYLVGNDFIPNIPNFHINTNALPQMYEAYMRVLPNLDGYINEGGILNLKRLEVFMAELAVIDKSFFLKENTNLDGWKADQINNDETFGGDDNNLIKMPESGGGDFDLGELIQRTNDMFPVNDDEYQINSQTFENSDDYEFYLHKREYYMKKLGYKDVSPDVLAEQAECYVRALQWTLHYYYRGVCSWSWYYPHHYAPYISDVQNFSHLKLDYDIGIPFLPFQQLLAVLPPASRSHLPTAYHSLMTSEHSKVIDYYPENFQTDLNGKKQDWEAIVLIPFIEEQRLLSAMAECDHKLSGAEVARNIHGPMYQYEYSEKDHGQLSAGHGIAHIEHIYCEETPITRDDLNVLEENLILGPSIGASRDIYMAGFPSMRHLPHEGIIEKAQVRVFDMPSRNESVIISLTDPVIHESEWDLEKIGRELIDKEIYVSWPHLTLAKVCAVFDEKNAYNTNEGLFENNSRSFQMQCKSLYRHYHTRMGLKVGDIKILVCVQQLIGKQYKFLRYGEMVLEKIWDDLLIYYPIQSIVKELQIEKSNDIVEYKDVEDVFVKNSTVFMVNNMYYGSRGIVVDSAPVKTCSRIKIAITVDPEPDFTLAKIIEESNKQKYMGSYDAAACLAMSNNLFSVITGTFLVVLGNKRFPLPDNTPKLNIGLQLKFPKKFEEVNGYTKKVDNQYLYSQKAVELVERYYNACPQVFVYLASHSNNDLCFEETLFPNGSSGELEKVSKWVKENIPPSLERRKCGTLSLETDTLNEIVKVVEQLKDQPLRSIILQVKPQLVYKPGLNVNSKIAPDPLSTFELFDRVVVVKDTHSVPLGHKGTIIAIETMSDPNAVRQEAVRKTDYFYDVLFDEPFVNGSSIEGVADKRVFKISALHLLNISYGQAKFCDKKKPATTIESTIKPTATTTTINDNKKSKKFNTSSKIQTTEQNFTTMTKNKNITENPQEQQQQQQPPQTIALNVVNKNIDIWEMLKNNAASSSSTTNVTETDQKNGNVISNVMKDQSTFLMEQLKVKNTFEKNENSTNKSKSSSSSSSTAHFEQFQKINVEDLFKVDTMKLPKPPQTWSNQTPQVSSKNNITNQKLQSNPITLVTPKVTNIKNELIYHPQAAKNVMPQHQKQPPPAQQQQQQRHLQQQQLSEALKMGGNFPRFQHPQQQQQQQQHQQHQYQQQKQFYQQPNGSGTSGPYFYNQNNPKPQTPNGPQKLSYNYLYPAGQGAFIPLQAHKNMKQKLSVVPPKTEQRQQQQEKTSQQQIAPATLGNTSTAAVNKSQENQQQLSAGGNGRGGRQPVNTNFIPPPRQRSSRIAAKFDGGT